MLQSDSSFSLTATLFGNVALYSHCQLQLNIIVHLFSFRLIICLWDNAVHHCHEEFLPVKSFSFHIFHTWRLFWTLQIDVMYCHCFLFSLIPPSLSPYLSRACFLCVLTLRHFSCNILDFFFFCHVISGSGINHAAQSLQWWSLLLSWSSSKNADLQNSVLLASVFHLILTSLLCLKMRKIHFSVLLLRLPLSKFCVAEHR